MRAESPVCFPLSPPAPQPLSFTVELPTFYTWIWKSAELSFCLNPLLFFQGEATETGWLVGQQEKAVLLE